jgi:hypothetical protein
MFYIFIKQICYKILCNTYAFCILQVSFIGFLFTKCLQKLLTVSKNCINMRFVLYSQFQSPVMENKRWSVLLVSDCKDSSFGVTGRKNIWSFSLSQSWMSFSSIFILQIPVHFLRPRLHDSFFLTSSPSRNKWLLSMFHIIYTYYDYSSTYGVL